MEKDILSLHDQKKGGVAKLVSDKVDFRGKNIISRDKEGYFKMIMVSNQEDITILNKYVPHTRA